jgi:hypothetical protein
VTLDITLQATGDALTTDAVGLAELGNEKVLNTTGSTPATGADGDNGTTSKGVSSALGNARTTGDTSRDVVGSELRRSRLETVQDANSTTIRGETTGLETGSTGGLGALEDVQKIDTTTVQVGRNKEVSVNLAAPEDPPEVEEKSSLLSWDLSDILPEEKESELQALKERLRVLEEEKRALQIQDKESKELIEKYRKEIEELKAKLQATVRERARRCLEMRKENQTQAVEIDKLRLKCEEMRADQKRKATSEKAQRQEVHVEQQNLNRCLERLQSDCARYQEEIRRLREPPTVVEGNRLGPVEPALTWDSFRTLNKGKGWTIEKFSKEWEKHKD